MEMPPGESVAASPTLWGMTVLSDPAHQQQHKDDDQDDPDHAYAAVTVAVAVTAKAATEAPGQENDEKNDQYETK
jgi:hypothetical protein